MTEYEHLCEEFDKCIEHSKEYEDMSTSWCVLLWPYGFLRWRTNNRKAKEILGQMRKYLQSHHYQVPPIKSAF